MSSALSPLEADAHDFFIVTHVRTSSILRSIDSITTPKTNMEPENDDC